MAKLWFALIVLACLLSGCSKMEQDEKIRLAINPWPGYEFLYLAGQKGFFAEAGLNVEIVELSSLADVQRIYTQGRIDAFGSTVIEAVQSAGVTQQPLDIILIPDFSNGGDVIIGNASVRSLADLKGKKVGTEVGSLGMFILHAALAKHGMSLDDVEVINVEQLEVHKQMKNGLVDAVVTYPPYSLSVLRLPGHNQIFDTTEIPGQVIDTISMRHGAVKDTRAWVDKFHQVWLKVLDFARKNPAEAHSIMAQREGISVAEFADALTGLQVVSSQEQNQLLKSDTLKNNIKEVCEVLARAKSITFECNNINALVRGYNQE